LGDAITDVLNWLESRKDIQSLRAAVCDLNGIMRGKRIPVEQAPMDWTRHPASRLDSAPDRALAAVAGR